MGTRTGLRGPGALTSVLALVAGTLLVAIGADPARAAIGSPAHPPTAAAPGAAPSVKINTIKSKKAGTYGDVLVSPSVTVKGNVQVSKKVLSVKKGGKTVVRDKKSARLKAGTYKVTQKVSYRTFSNKTVHPVVFRQGDIFGDDLVDEHSFVDECAVTSVAENQADFEAACKLTWFETRTDPDTFEDEIVEEWFWTDIPTSGTYDAENSRVVLDGDIELTAFEAPQVGTDYLDLVTQIRVPFDLFITKVQRVYSKTVTRTKAQTLVVKKGPPLRSCASYTDFKRVSVDFDEPWNYGDSKSAVARLLRTGGKRVSVTDTGSAVIEVRSYKACARGASIRVGFEDGYAYAKNYSK